MKIERIIEIVNKYIEDKRKELKIQTKGHLVLQKTIKASGGFKLYKEYTITLWFVKDKKKYSIYASKGINSGSNNEDILDEACTYMLKDVFEWLNTPFFDKIVKGEYDGNKDE